MRGFGASTPMPRDFPWTLDVIIDDYVRLMDALKIDRFHLVGAKIGGIIVRAFAARRPHRVRTLTVVGSPPPLRTDQDRQAPTLKEIEEQGIDSGNSRLAGNGSEFHARAVAGGFLPCGGDRPRTLRSGNARVHRASKYSHLVTANAGVPDHLADFCDLGLNGIRQLLRR
jgi:pimeloyl-ACP methyl ester carboxylesterase